MAGETRFWIYHALLWLVFICVLMGIFFFHGYFAVCLGSNTKRNVPLLLFTGIGILLMILIIYRSYYFISIGSSALTPEQETAFRTWSDTTFALLFIFSLVYMGSMLLYAGSWAYGFKYFSTMKQKGIYPSYWVQGIPLIHEQCVFMKESQVYKKAHTAIPRTLPPISESSADSEGKGKEIHSARPKPVVKPSLSAPTHRRSVSSSVLSFDNISTVSPESQP